jgi:hypothetical protein
MTEKRFTDCELYFTNMVLSLIAIIFISIFPYALWQISLIYIGGIGFLNLGLFLDSWD